ncbi:MAG: SDR family oxidoreductase [Planctomycetota bacterium]|nr:SDR family oxidoreductase [Planctomycetota bacterium]
MPANPSTPAVLVCGASGTLGGAVARALHRRGCALGLHRHAHPERLPELPCKAYAADFRDPEQPAALAKAFLSDFGRLDALVWAAGIARDAPAAAQSEADVREVLAVDLSAPFLLAKALARTFLKQKAGSVVFLSSHAALSGRAGGAAYAMAQAGLLSLMKSLAREWGPLGVRVNAVVPPFVRESEMGRAASEAFVEAVARRNVLKLEADPAAEAGRFIADLLENRTACGQVFTLDGRIAI